MSNYYYWNPVTGKMETQSANLSLDGGAGIFGLANEQGQPNTDPTARGADPTADYWADQQSPDTQGPLDPSSYASSQDPINWNAIEDPINMHPWTNIADPTSPPDYSGTTYGQDPGLDPITEAQIAGVSNGTNQDPWYKQVLSGAAGLLPSGAGNLAQQGIDLIPGGGGGVPAVQGTSSGDINTQLVSTGPFGPDGAYNPGNPDPLTFGDANPTDLSSLGPDPQFTVDAGGSGDPQTVEGAGTGTQPLSTGGGTSSSSTGGTMPYSSTRYPYTTAEPVDAFAQNRIAAADYTNQSMDDLTASANRNAGDYQSFKNQAYSGQGGYGDVLAGTAGYSAQELQGMYQSDLINSGMATDTQLGQYNYTDAEKSAITGDPMAGLNTFQSGMTGVNSATTDAAALGLGAVGEMKDMYGNAIDPSKLGLSADYLENYNVSPLDMQNIRDSAGRTVGLNAQSEIDRLSRAAAAQGSTSPLALASAMTRRSYTGDINAATAMTDADIKARQLGLTVAANREAMRLGSEEDISNRQMTSAQQVGTAGLQNAQLTGTQGIDTAKYGTAGSAAYAASGDTAASQRATDLAAAERAALTTQLGTNYQQKMGVGTFNSGVATTNANMNQSLAAQGRTYLTTQEAAAKAAEEEALSLKNSAAATGFTSVNAATSGQAQAKLLPTAWDKGLNVAFGAGSAISGAF